MRMRLHEMEIICCNAIFIYRTESKQRSASLAIHIYINNMKSVSSWSVSIVSRITIGNVLLALLQQRLYVQSLVFMIIVFSSVVVYNIIMYATSRLSLSLWTRSRYTQHSCLVSTWSDGSTIDIMMNVWQYIYIHTKPITYIIFGRQRSYNTPSDASSFCISCSTKNNDAWQVEMEFLELATITRERERDWILKITHKCCVLFSTARLVLPKSHDTIYILPMYYSKLYFASCVVIMMSLLG